MKRFMCILLSLMITLCSGCIEKKEESKLIEKNYLIYNLGEFPKDLIMIDSDSIREKDLLLGLFEGLVRVDEFGGVLPGIAESWEISSDELHYTFNIRDNARWSNGEKVTAQDFVGLFKELLDKKNNNYAEQLFCIFGVQDYYEGKVDFNSVAIDAVDSKTLHIGLNFSDNNFINILSQPIFTLRNIKELDGNWQKEYSKIQYTGPFVIEAVGKNEKIYLCKNKKYWRKQEVQSEKILITSIKESEKALVKFENSQTSEYIDIFIEPPINEIERLMEKNQIVKFPSLRVFNLEFNMKKNNIIDDVDFRRAISSVISKEFIIENIARDIAVPASSYVPPIVNKGFSNKYGEKYYFSIYGDKFKGNEYLKKCKMDLDKPIKLVYKKNYLNKRICDNIVKNIEDYLNIDLIAQGFDEKELIEVIEQGDYDIVQTDFIEKYDNILRIYEKWVSSSKLNRYGYCNQEYDNLISLAASSNNLFERNKLLEEACEILVNDVPTVPIYFYNTLICKREYVKGLCVTKSGNVMLDRVYKEK